MIVLLQLISLEIQQCILELSILILDIIFLRDHMNKGDCIIEYVDTKHQLAYIFIKPLAKDRFYELIRIWKYYIRLKWIKTIYFNIFQKILLK